MAAKLQCEICGGKLIGKPGGIFECDSCGVEYSTAWAKEKIQEIKGTVRIEGPVEVQGTVSVDSGASKEALTKRGMMALEEEKWDEAKTFFDQALNYDAEYSEAYLGLAMVDGKCKDRDSFINSYCAPYSHLYESISIQRAKKYAKADLLRDLIELDEKRIKIITPILQHNKQMLESILEVRNQPARALLKIHKSGIYGLKTDGSLLVCPDERNKAYMEKYYSSDLKKIYEASSWQNVVSFCLGDDHIIGLKRDGTVLATGYNFYGQCDVSSWSDVSSIKAYNSRSFGIKTDGTVVASGENTNGELDIEKWTDIKDVFFLSAGSSKVTVGLKQNGTMVWCGKIHVFDDPEKYRELTKWKDIVKVIHHPFKNEDLLYGIRADGSFTIWSSKGILEGEIKQDSILVDKIEDSFGWIGLWSDKTVSCGKNPYSEDVVEICGNVGNYYCLHSDGTISIHTEHEVDEGNVLVRKWSGINTILSGGFFCRFLVYGLCENGMVVTTDEQKKSELSKWKLFNDYHNVENERIEAIKNAEIMRKTAQEQAVKELQDAIKRKQSELDRQIEMLNAEKKALRTELDNNTSIFSRKRRRDILQRLSEIDSKLDGMK